MAGINEPVPENNEATPTNSGGGESHDSSENGLDYKENHANGIFNGAVVDNEKEQELLELIRDTEGRRGLMAGMPFINLSELTVILRDPSMPSHKIMNEIADKIMLRTEESKGDDGAVGRSDVGRSDAVVGMKWLLDRIFEEVYEQTNPNNSDEEDECFERIPLEIPCSFCDKVFASTMTSTTHVLVAHQDPSVLNIRRLSHSEDNKEKTHVPSRKHSKSSTKSEADDTHTRHTPKKNTKKRTEHGEENVLSGRRQSSHSQHSEPSDKHPSRKEQVEGVSPLKVNKVNLSASSGDSTGLGEAETVAASDASSGDSTGLGEAETVAASDASSGDSTGLGEAATIAASESKIVESADQCVANNPTQLPESGSVGSTEGMNRVEPAAACRADSQDSRQSPQDDASSRVIGSMKDGHEEDSNSSAETLTTETNLGVDILRGRKRRALPLSEPSSSTSPPSPSSSLNPKRSRKQVAKENYSRSTEEQDL